MEIKIRIYCQGRYDEMMSRYKQLLLYIKTAVTRNYSEKSINSILDYISTSKQVKSTYPPFNKSTLGSFLVIPPILGAIGGWDLKFDDFTTIYANRRRLGME